MSEMHFRPLKWLRPLLIAHWSIVYHISCSLLESGLHSCHSNSLALVASLAECILLVNSFGGDRVTLKIFPLKVAAMWALKFTIYNTIPKCVVKVQEGL